MSPFISSIQKLLLRDLDKLEQEIRLYPTRESLWLIKGDIKNPAGNLCLHLCGNLQHYFGANLGNTGYKRNRDAEFSTRDLPPEKLTTEIQAAKAAIQKTFLLLKEEDMDNEYPEKVFADPMTSRFFFIHLTAHLSYHLGQVNYHRRLVATGV
jgi:Protein of unknown function (DUF1572)